MGKVAPYRSHRTYLINQRVGALRAKDKGRIHPRYAGFLLSSWPFQQNFIAVATSSGGQANLSPNQILSVEIALPPIAEQRLIASLLGLLDDKIELNRRMNATLEAQAQAIFRDWFVDFGPVRRRMAGASDPVAIMGGLTSNTGGTAPAKVGTGFASGASTQGTPTRAATLAALFPATLGDNGLPEGWKAGTLGDIAKAVGETVDPKSLRPDTPYFGLEHLPRRSITLDDWGQAASVNSNKAKFKAGQVLFGKLRPYFHKVGIAPLDGVCSTDIVVMDGIRPIDRPFVVSCASSKSFVDYTDQGSTGTKMPRTSWGQMKKYPLVISTALVRDAYSEIVQPMHNKIIAAVHENRTLAETRDYLLPRLMSGAVRVTAESEAA